MQTSWPSQTRPGESRPGSHRWLSATLSLMNVFSCIGVGVSAAVTVGVGVAGVVGVAVGVARCHLSASRPVGQAGSRAKGAVITSATARLRCSLLVFFSSRPALAQKYLINGNLCARKLCKVRQPSPAKPSGAQSSTLCWNWPPRRF